MTSFHKNLMVGIVVLGALGVLGWMILKFGEKPVEWFSEPKMKIHFVASRADGLSIGSPVLYRGVSVGIIESVKRSAEDLTAVQIEAAVDRSPPLPANVVGVIRSQLVGGGSSLSLELTDAQPTGQLQSNQQVKARFVGVDVLPPAFAELADELRLTAKQLRESDAIPHLDQTIVTIREQVLKAGEVVESLQKVVGDEKMRDDLRASISNFRTATETATKVARNLEKASEKASATLDTTQASVDQISKQVGERLTQISKLLETFQSISTKIDKGDGTAGLLVNDPKLYQALVDSSRELNATITDLRRLVEQWEQEGVSLKLSK